MSTWKKFVLDKDNNVEIFDRDYTVLESQKEYGNIKLGGISAWPFLEICDNIIIKDGGLLAGVPRLKKFNNMYVSFDAVIEIDFNKVAHGNIIVEPYHYDLIKKNFDNYAKFEFNEYNKYNSWIIPPNYYRGLSIKQEIAGIKQLLAQVHPKETYQKRIPTLFNNINSPDFAEKYGKIYQSNVKKFENMQNEKIQTLKKQLKLEELKKNSLINGLNIIEKELNENSTSSKSTSIENFER